MDCRKTLRPICCHYWILVWFSFFSQWVCCLKVSIKAGILFFFLKTQQPLKILQIYLSDPLVKTQRYNRMFFFMGLGLGQPLCFCTQWVKINKGKLLSCSGVVRTQNEALLCFSVNPFSFFKSRKNVFHCVFQKKKFVYFFSVKVLFFRAKFDLSTKISCHCISF